MSRAQGPRPLRMLLDGTNNCPRSDQGTFRIEERNAWKTTRKKERKKEGSNEERKKGTQRNPKEPKGTQRNPKEPKEPKGTQRNPKEPKGTPNCRTNPVHSCRFSGNIWQHELLTKPLPSCPGLAPQLRPSESAGAGRPSWPRPHTFKPQ